METYQIKKTGLEIRDPDAPFNGAAIDIHFFRMEKVVFMRMSNAIALTAAIYMSQALTRRDLLELFADIRQAVAATFGISPDSVVDIHFDATAGVIYVLSGDIISFVNDMTDRHRNDITLKGH